MDTNMPESASTESTSATAPAKTCTGQTILVCGGAGYIGSHMVRLLAQQGHTPVIFDNLSTGHLDVMDSLLDPDRPESARCIELVRGDLLDQQTLRRVFAEYSFDAVMHFAARSLVSESVTQPAVYYRNNVAGTLNLLDTMRETGVEKIVFSSTCAVYGAPQEGVTHIAESHPLNPGTPYGHNKRMVEQMLADFGTAYGLRSMSLRYFNAAGAHPDGDLGEAHSPESHLIPNVLKAALGQGSLKVFGTDYPTPDGTCVRDYIHILDLCDAHLAALEFLTNAAPGSATICNLGNGNGFSVLEVLESARRVTGRDIPYETAPRRAGDAPFLVGDAGLARTLLNWRPVYTSLDECVATAWRWHQNPKY